MEKIDLEKIKEWTERFLTGQQEYLINELQPIYSTKGHLLDQPQRPTYQGNMDEVVSVSMNQQAVTRATASKTVLTTHGLGPCVSLVGYEPSAKVGFLTHYSSVTNVDQAFPNLLYQLYQTGLTHEEPNKFEVRIIGGWDPLDSLINKLRARLSGGTLFNMEIVGEEIGDLGNGRGRNVALDTRTGELFSYDPKLNPNDEGPSELECMQMLLPLPTGMVYTPN